FALKYEGIDLLILKKLFQSINRNKVKEIVKQQPTGRYSRRIWFFYEWLMDEKLHLADVKTGNYIAALDPKLQFPGPEHRSKRHRVVNNLPGNKDFCPLIRRTAKIESNRSNELDKKVKTT